MNVGFITNGYEQNLSGINRYTKGILECLRSRQIKKYCFGRDYLNIGNMTEMHILKEGGGISEMAMKEQYLLRKLACLDIVYSFFNPILLEKHENIKSILTIHDLAPLVNRRWHGYCQDIYDIFNIQLRESAHRVDKIIAVSEATKKSIIDIYEIAEDKIEIVTPAIASDLVDSNPTEQEMEVVRQKYSIASDYLLSICTFEPRKNLVSLIEAYGIYREKNKESSVQLVLVGKLGWNFNDILEKIHNSKYKKDIIVTDYVSDYELSVLYKGAIAFAYVSYFEGFGMPVLEALHYGKAVLTSNVSSMPEVGGEAACYCNPYELDSIYSSLEHLLEDREYRQDLERKAKPQSENFSYEKSARFVEKLIFQLDKELVK